MTSISAASALTPFRHGLRWPRLAAVAGSTVPVCVVALAVALDGGHVLPALVLTGLVVVAFTAVLSLALLSRVELRPNGLRSHRITGARTVQRAQVAKTVFRRIQNRDELTSQRYLYLLDRSGAALLRMSDRWWTEAQMMAVATHVGAPIETTDEIVYLSELRRSVPQQLTWQDRHPALWVVARVVVVSAGSLLIAALATASI